MSFNEAAIAANRFGFGARPGDLRAIAGDPRGWIRSQLAPEPALPAPLAALPPAEDDLLAFGRFYVSQRLNGPNGARIKQRLERQGVSADMQARTVEDDFREHFRARYENATKARLDTAFATPRPVFERLAHFWANHFTVSVLKPQAAGLPPSFEREAIRPHVTGRFADMLLASSRHPGMTVYLDNWMSIGPHSLWAREPQRVPRIGFGPGGRPSGLNENLGREILELHTLGVNGGYTQQDVQALAAILTGWTYRRPDLQMYFSDVEGVRTGAQLFAFEGDAHEPGAKTLLGKTYADSGEREGVAALSDLARHPATARFIATKLARHYIADTSPPAAVDRIAQAFSRSDGDLRATMDAVIDSPETWAQPFAKFKRPEEFLISAMRALDIRQLPPGVGAVATRTMGQPMYAAPGPDGWSDISAPWMSGDLVWKRIEWCGALAQRVARADADPVQIGETALGPLLSADTREAVARADSPAQGLVLLFTSPEFQRR